MQRYVDFIAAKRGLATALHLGDPAFEVLPAYFQQRLEPALRTLPQSAATAGEVPTDIAANGSFGRGREVVHAPLRAGTQTSSAHGFAARR